MTSRAGSASAQASTSSNSAGELLAISVSTFCRQLRLTWQGWQAQLRRGASGLKNGIRRQWRRPGGAGDGGSSQGVRYPRARVKKRCLILPVPLYEKRLFSSLHRFSYLRQEWSLVPACEARKRSGE